MTVRHEHEILGEVALGPRRRGARVWLGGSLAGATLGAGRRCARARAARRRRVRAPGHRRHARPSRGRAASTTTSSTALRPMARAGDVLLVVAGARRPRRRRRCGARRRWGLTTIWLGAGAPPMAATADHVLWLSDDPTGSSRRSPRARLPRAVGAHPRLLRAPGSAREPRTTTATVCITLLRRGPARRGRRERPTTTPPCARRAGVETVSTLMVGPVQPGDLVLVHAGTAITVVDP